MGVVKRGARSQGEREAKGGEVWGKTRGGQVTLCVKLTLGYLSGVGCFWQESSALGTCIIHGLRERPSFTQRSSTGGELS
jgi:hypothetical protein